MKLSIEERKLRRQYCTVLCRVIREVEAGRYRRAAVVARELEKLNMRRQIELHDGGIVPEAKAIQMLIGNLLKAGRRKR